MTQKTSANKTGNMPFDQWIRIDPPLDTNLTAIPPELQTHLRRLDRQESFEVFEKYSEEMIWRQKELTRHWLAVNDQVKQLILVVQELHSMVMKMETGDLPPSKATQELIDRMSIMEADIAAIFAYLKDSANP